MENWRKTYRPNKKSETTERSDTKDDIWDNNIPLTEPTLKNSPRKQYLTRNRKPVLRYVFEEGMLYTLTLNFRLIL